MLIVCPHCATTYDIETTALGAEGRSVRCTRCRTVWFAPLPEAALEIMGGPAGEANVPADQTTVEVFPAETLEPAADSVPDPIVAVEDEATQEAAAAGIEAVDAPPLAPAQQFAPGQGPFPITGGDIGAFMRRKADMRAQRRRVLPALPKLRWPLNPLPTLILGLSAVVVVIIGWREEAVRLLPQTASLYSAIGLRVNLRGLTFENVKTSREIHEGVPVMVVEGEIVSVSRHDVDVPRLRFGVRNGPGAEIYSWTAMPSRTKAGPGERLAFRSRLASPPVEMHDISVRFYHRRDAMVGLR